ncbi:copper transporter [Luteipulveratus halotolerans]|uniref:Copper transporter n=1 Tax=Luteipulveratus halotolerans TaxID=1631356 RepID=A0A0L6CIK5_9MICO|nr:copper transporter [Luteipulveratus halotolerans]KNX37343.1 hypothetical protein VV01_09585 [Luteipulveratus halotolerans]
MIDFRYHIVSIVAVFLALAVGIVIGATSLRDGLAGSLNQQVESQRRQLNDARDQRKAAEKVVGRQDAYAESVAPKVLPGQLSGRTVAVVVLPGTDDGLVDSSRDSLRTAGASVTTTLRLDESWVSGSGSDRDRVVRDAATALGLDTASIPKNRLAGKVIVESVAHSGSGGRPDEAATGVLGQLKDNDLGESEPAGPTQAASVVVLWPGMSAGGDNASTVKAWSDVITAIGLSGRPVVGVASGPVKDDLTSPDGLVNALRHSPEVTGAMSTVDDGDMSVGQAALVLALREEFKGQAGQFGLADTATTITPNLSEGE